MRSTAVHFGVELANLARVLGANFLQSLTEFAFFVDERRLVAVGRVASTFQLRLRVYVHCASAASHPITHFSQLEA